MAITVAVDVDVAMAVVGMAMAIVGMVMGVCMVVVVDVGVGTSLCISARVGHTGKHRNLDDRGGVSIALIP